MGKTICCYRATVLRCCRLPAVFLHDAEICRMSLKYQYLADK
jgi:hypothetical protein